MNKRLDVESANDIPQQQPRILDMSQFKPVLELSEAILKCRRELRASPSKRRKADLKMLSRSLERRFQRECSALVAKISAGWYSERRISAVVASEFESLKEVTDPRLHAAIDNVKRTLMALADDATDKTAGQRVIEKNTWWIACIGIVVTVVALKWFWMVPVGSPMEIVSGVVEGSDAFEKYYAYDTSLGIDPGGPGALKKLIYWPATPNQAEKDKAVEFLETTVAIFDEMSAEGTICGALPGHDNADGSYADEIVIAGAIVDYVNAKRRIKGDASGRRFIEFSFRRAFPC